MSLANDRDLAASIAVTRFGLGARPGEIDAARADPQGFLKAQIRPEGADQPAGDLGNSSQNLAVFDGLRRERKQEKADQAAADALKQTGQQIRELAIREMAARGALAASTPAAFRERWTLFWSNHFTVSAVKGTVAPIAGSFEREAIRPHVFGRFEDMLLASTRHPAMLLYLDQAQSTGPDSVVGQRRKAGLNENLAREIMELHTVGLGAGYTQADVTEFARALTGWSISRGQGAPNAMADIGPSGAFMYRPFLHEPGVRHVLGKSYAQDGEAQGAAVLHDLAYHPATADHVAAKLARHFVADDPPPGLQAQLKASFISSGGRLDEVARTLIDAPEAWQPQAAKFKTPYEFLVSSWRAAGQAPDLSQPQKFVGSLAQMGQRPFSPDSPKGWSDEAVDWASADGVVKRLAWSEQAAAAMTAQGLDPNQTAQAALGARLTPVAAQAIARAETRQEAFAVLLMSPEFQRR